MKNSYTIHIPKPCHENWDVMAPVEQGRFCQSCAKEVVDFSMMTDQEVLNYFSKATGNTCGRFNNDQLQRPLQPTKIEKKKAWWLALIMPLLLFFGKIKAQKKESAANRIEISIKPAVMCLVSHSLPGKQFPKNLLIKRTKGDQSFNIEGRIVEFDSKTPVAFAIVRVDSAKTVTDINGNFSIHGTTNKPVVKLHALSVGFEERELKITIQDTIPAASTITVKGDTIIRPVLDGNNIVPVLKKDGVFVVPEVAVMHEQDTAGLQSQLTSYLQATAGAVVCYKPLARIDTIPTYIRKVFNKEVFKVFPNPVQNGNEITVNIKKEGSYSIQLYNSNGSLILAQPFDAIKPAAQTSISIPAGLTPGMYYIKLFDNKSRKQYTDKLIIM